MEDRVAQVLVHSSLIATLFPEGTEVISVYDVPYRDTWAVKVRHPSLPLVAEGMMMPSATVVATKVHAHFEVLEEDVCR